MASVGEMRYYIAIKTYTQAKNADGAAARILNKTLYYFVSIKELSGSEKLRNGIALGDKRISAEMVKTVEEIQDGDELIYNGITYRIDSIEMDNFKNRTYINAKATDRG